MNAVRLQLDERYDAWHGGAWTGRLVAGSSEVAVLAVLGPVARAGALDRAIAAAATLLEVRAPGTLPLLEVRAHQDRLAWIYERRDVVSMGAIATPTLANAMPIRAAAEGVALAVDVLVALARHARHPGPDAMDVLLEPTGRVVLAGFVGPYGPRAGLRAPGDGSADEAQAYRVGAMLAQALTGSAPPEVQSRSEHEGVVRRVLVRCVGRSGEPFPDRLGEWLRGLLAWDPGLRPVLSTVSGGLRSAVQGTPGALAEWAESGLPVVRLQAEREARRVRASLPLGLAEEEWSTEGDTFPRAADLDEVTFALEDEATQEAARHSEAPSPGRPPQDSALSPLSTVGFPVEVGPPAEVAQNRPSLPAGFLAGDPWEPTAGGPLQRGGLMWVFLGLLSAGAAVALVGAIFLLNHPGDPPAVLDDPSVADALLRPVPPPSVPFDVVFVVRGGQPFSVLCEGIAPVAGLDAVSVTGLLAGQCTVTGMLDGAAVVAVVDVTGAGTVRCFQTHQAVCR